MNSTIRDLLLALAIITMVAGVISSALINMSLKEPVLQTRERLP